ncbi:MAG: hypothetical protein QXI59_03610 [Candidatus Bathyarchaeia archaeon]|nr:hypothetical protein [Candidatus Bathyarchaeota archaeon]
MSARVFLGISLVVLGAIFALYSAYNVNELVFIQERLSRSDIHLYAGNVALPMMVGLLLIVDGLIICGFSRRSSILFHVPANLIWILISYRLYFAIQEPTETRLTFYRIFVFMVFAACLFIGGAVVNFIPKSRG